ncbi:hypothetical protein [Kaarinaea lacus]
MKYTRQKHDGKDVTWDFNTYVDCEFTNCKLIYKGGALPVLENCTFDNCEFVLTDRAENTVNYLQYLNNHMAELGGAALVEATIAKIKSS